MISLNVPFLLNSEIALKANDFIKTNKLNSIPIDIESIAEIKYNIDIIPFSDLKREYGIDGLSSRDCNSIYVDKYIYEERLNRLRFTIAHELSHIILHKQYIQQIGWSSIEEWLTVYENIDDKDIDYMEYQAYVFAGLILVPQNILKRLFVSHLPKLDNLIEEAKRKKLARKDYVETVIFLIAELLSYQFEASKDVIGRRIKFDGLDNLIE
jgi:Zn-dependent peptidase ImmA (M78 family)